VKQLLLDIGNTRVKWRSFPAHPAGSGAIAHLRPDVMGALAALWQDMQIERVLYASVAADSMTREVTALCASCWPEALVERIVSQPVLGGIRNGYQDPESLGADRLLAMIGARARFGPNALLVASLGTATTLDLVDEDGQFLGGAILPGPALMAHSLAGGTAGLPEVVLRGSDQAEDVLGTTTEDAIRMGVLYAQAGAVERAFRILVRNHAQLSCVVSGGAAQAVVPHLPFSANLADNLVLDGLAALAATKD